MTDQDQYLREAFASLSQSVQADSECPAPETLLAAVQGQLPEAEVKAVIAHTASCGACAEDWRISYGFATDMAKLEPQDAPQAKIIAFPARRWLTPLAAAAAILLAVLVFRQQPEPAAPEWRDQPRQSAVRSLLPEQQPLRRDDCVLRWAVDGAVPGTRYEVQVTTADVFNVIAVARDLEQTELRLSAEQLAKVPAGGQLLWWVKATTADGIVVQSETFTQLLGP